MGDDCELVPSRDMEVVAVHRDEDRVQDVAPVAPRLRLAYPEAFNLDLEFVKYLFLVWYEK